VVLGMHLQIEYHLALLSELQRVFPGIKIFLRRDITSKLRTEMVPQRKFNSRMMKHMNLNLMTVRMMMEMLVPP